MNQKILLICSFITILAVSTFSCTSEISHTGQANAEKHLITAKNPCIFYCGRFDKSDPEKAVFDWPGIYIKAAFEGTSCAVRLNDGKNLYSIVIDDNEPLVLVTDTNTVYSVASDLDDTIHTIIIQKRTEALVGKGEFLGFILDKDKKLVDYDFIKQRRIEFIGNSITCGYGVEGKSVNEHFAPETENAILSYASIVSRNLNADYALISYSGRGMVRNYGDTNKTSDEPMPFLYPRTVCNQADPVWDYTTWIPQVVVINLGTNDFSTQPYPDKEVYIEAYHALIAKIKNQYPGVTIFCICGPMIGEPCTSYVKKVVNHYNSDDKVYFIPIPQTLLNDNDWGSDWHPNISGQQKSADVIIPVIKNVMGW